MGEPAAPPCSFCCAVCDDGRVWFSGGVAPNQVHICDACIRSCRTTLSADDVKRARRARFEAGMAVLHAVQERIVGQQVACRAVTAVLVEHHAELERRQHEDDGPRHSPRLLIVGPPGSGKTTLCEAVRDAASWPVVHTHAERHAVLNVPAGVIDDEVVGLYARTREDLDEAERGVVIVDGLDLRVPGGSDSLDRRAATMRELLRLLDGATFKTTNQRQCVRSDGMLCVVAATVAPAVLEDVAESAVRASLLRMGVASAFLARFDRVVALRALGLDEMRELLARPRGLIDRAKRIAGLVGSELAIARGAIEVFAAAAAADPDGGWAVARPLHRLVEDMIATPGEPWLVDEIVARKYIASP